jgi:hypothetical protein
MDQAGNATNPDPSVSYLVIYNLTGFQAPLLPAVMLNPPNPASPPQPIDSGSFTIGTSIPIAWQLQDAANAYISDPTTLTSIVAIPNPACSGVVSAGAITLYNSSTGQAAFSYDNVHNRFVFNWSTTGMVAGCYNLVVTTSDTAQWSTIVHLSTDALAGFDAPLAAAAAAANPSNSGAFDTGSTIPVMFQLNIPNVGPDTAQNVRLSNVTAYANAGCAGSAPANSTKTVLYDVVSNAGSFNFEPNDSVYAVNWATGAATAGCYNIVVTLSDQSVYATMVSLAPAGGVTTLLQYNFDNVPMGGGSQTAPPSFVSPNVAGGVFGYSTSNPNGMFSNGCALAICIDLSGVMSGDYYSFSLTNTTPVTNASISLWEFNNDCHATSCSVGQSFLVEYDTDSVFSNPTPVTVANFTPPAPGFQSYSFPISGTLLPNTYYFRIVATGSNQDGTGQYVLDNVTIAGSH